jgi:hypothetical protein
MHPDQLVRFAQDHQAKLLAEARYAHQIPRRRRLGLLRRRRHAATQWGSVP